MNIYIDVCYICANITTYKHTKIQTYKPTKIQTYKDTKMQTYKHIATHIHEHAHANIELTYINYERVLTHVPTACTYTYVHKYIHT